MHKKSAWLSIVVLGSLAACDIPTAAPKYTTQWDIPAKSTSISVNSLLPSGVSATADNSAFQATISPSSTTISRSLGQDCSACAASNGFSIPKPAFVGQGNASVALPSGVASATLVRDTLTVTINNGFNFDPIRPSPTARGYYVVRVLSGTTVVGRDSLDGSAIAMPAGGVVTRKIALAGTIAGNGGLQIVTSLSSPAGDAVSMDMTRTISVSGSTGPLYLSSASVSLANQTVSSSATQFDLSSLDKSITDRVNDGALELTVTNPFAATGNLSVTLTADGTTITKPVVLGSGTTTPVVSLTKSDLQALFGHQVAIGFAGTVSGSNVVVTPGQTVSVVARMQIGLNTGSNQ
ncbi:MAG TPA: hypothetical protein VN706_02710 [Gemmatimonadaceae bacterium]|nr:hypothetical protein [Gemmatimonadaceae bacterium]